MGILDLLVHQSVIFSLISIKATDLAYHVFNKNLNTDEKQAGVSHKIYYP